MDGSKEADKKILERADQKWEQRGGQIPEAIRERVKKKFYEMVNKPDTMSGLKLVKGDVKLHKWMSKIFEGAHTLVKKNLD